MRAERLPWHRRASPSATLDKSVRRPIAEARGGVKVFFEKSDVPKAKNRPPSAQKQKGALREKSTKRA